MAKKIAHIILFTFFTIFVANYAIQQFDHLKKDSITNIEEQTEEEVANETDDLLNNNFFVFQSVIRTISLFSFDLTAETTTTSNNLDVFSPHGFNAAVYLDLCIFKI